MAQGIYSEHIKMSKGIQGSYFTMPMSGLVSAGTLLPDILARACSRPLDAGGVSEIVVSAFEGLWSDPEYIASQRGEQMIKLSSSLSWVVVSVDTS
ncbi:Nipped-B-like protein [Trichinella spiralis]|uniref:Nipped-B-like protein n=1 Tax=Trichinella spiralis TaxID=6334 RepID=A0ABR3KNC0_TRISP